MINAVATPAAVTTTTLTTVTGKQKQQAEDPTIAIVKAIYRSANVLNRLEERLEKPD